MTEKTTDPRAGWGPGHAGRNTLRPNHTLPLPEGKFREVSRDAPCEICGKPDWCRRSSDGCIECHRNKGELSGYRLLKVTASEYGLYRPAAQQTPNFACRPAATRLLDAQNRRNVPGVTTDTPQTEIDAPSPSKRTSPTVEAFTATLGDRHGGTWVYEHADGSPTLAVVRVNEPDGGKRFVPLHPVPGGWAFGDPPGELPLYGLCDVLATPGRVYVVEGEKCAEAARSIGLLATTSAHGTKSPSKTDWTPLAGRDVAILPDDDEPGREYGHAVARILTHLNPPARVKIVEVPQ